MSRWKKVGWITRLAPGEEPDVLLVESGEKDVELDDIFDALFPNPPRGLPADLVPHQERVKHALDHSQEMSKEEIQRIFNDAREAVASALNIIAYEAIPVLGWKGPDSINGYMPQKQYYVLGPDNTVIGSVGPGEAYELERLDFGKMYEAWEEINDV